MRLLSARPLEYPCDSVEPSWQAGEWRWRDIENELREAGSAAIAEQRVAWRRRGVKLPAGSVEEQLAYLQRRRLRRVPDQRELELGGEPVRIVGLLRALTGMDEVTVEALGEAADAIGLKIDPFFATRVF